MGDNLEQYFHYNGDNCWTILSIARRIRIVNKLDTRMRSRHTQHGGFFLKNVIGSTFFIIFVLSLISSTK